MYVQLDFLSLVGKEGNSLEDCQNSIRLFFLHYVNSKQCIDWLSYIYVEKIWRKNGKFVKKYLLICKGWSKEKFMNRSRGKVFDKFKNIFFDGVVLYLYLHLNLIKKLNLPKFCRKNLGDFKNPENGLF